MVAPASLAKLTDLDQWRQSTLHHLLSSRNLGLISVWHPSFLTLLLEYLESHRNSVLKSLAPQRRREVAASFSSSGEFFASKAWPHLRMISCWTDASAHAFIPVLKKWFHGIEIQSKGLLATEGVISIPVTSVSQGCPVAVSAHFLEFVDLQNPNTRPLFIHELKVGGHYSPILTTSGGLYRYHLKDEVACVGTWHNTPCLRFLGKLDATSDLRGEKLTPAQVDAALTRIQSQFSFSWNFAMLGCHRGEPPHYILYVESNLDKTDLELVRNAMEQILSESHHYRYCRELGQLAPLQIRQISHAASRWQDALAAQGHRAGSLKPLSLDTRLNWDDVFGD
jgi:hypothetical protein